MMLFPASVSCNSEPDAVSRPWWSNVLTTARSSHIYDPSESLIPDPSKADPPAIATYAAKYARFRGESGTSWYAFPSCHQRGSLASFRGCRLPTPVDEGG